MKESRKVKKYKGVEGHGAHLETILGNVGEEAIIEHLPEAVERAKYFAQADQEIKEHGHAVDVTLYGLKTRGEKSLRSRYHCREG